MKSRLCLIAILAGASVIGTTVAFAAGLSSAQKKEVADVKKDVGKVASLITKKEFDEAEKILNESEEKLKSIAKAAGVEESDKALAATFHLIDQKRQAMAKKGGKEAPGVDFLAEVGPILASKCAKCHNDGDAKGGLQLDSFAGMEKGGRSGQLLTVGDASNSLIVYRLQATDNSLMPKGGPALSKAEISAIANWINKGAKFDGDKDEKFSTKARVKPKDEGPVTITKATGGEKVSFVRDIAPFMVNLCGGCHGGNNPRSGLSLTTFEGLMKGGDSGRVIIPGNLEGSRLWRLVGGLEGPRMPQGQARITRKNYEDLKTWLEEGAKFDGPNPKTPLRQLIPSDEEIAAAKFAKFSPDDFVKYRHEQTEEAFKRANPKEQAHELEDDEFIVYGNVSEDRLKEIQKWSDDALSDIRKTFGVKTSPVWKGKLAIIVLKDRFGYEEFPRVVEKQEVPRENTGFSKVNSTFEDAYICLEDVGDDPSAVSPGLRLNLVDHLTGAYLKQSKGQLPEWLIRGTGLMMASRVDKKNAYIAGLHGEAVGALQGIEKPDDILTNGTFSTAQVGPVGYTLVEHLVVAGRASNFANFVSKLQAGKDMNSALKEVYNSSAAEIGISYASSLGGRKATPKKKK